MTTIRIRNNYGANFNVSHNGDITIQGRFTYLATASEATEVHEDAPTNSMSGNAIAGGRDGDQPPIKPIKAKKPTEMIGSMIRRKVKDKDGNR
jgi:hypothetical protein